MGAPLPSADPRNDRELDREDLIRWLDQDGRALGWGREPPATAENADLAIGLFRQRPTGAVDIAPIARSLVPIERVRFELVATYAYRGHVDCLRAHAMFDRHRVRLAYVHWVIGQVIARRPAPAGFERWPIARYVVAAEDRRFWLHPGIDARAIVRAAARTIGGKREGGSTLIQQLVRHVLCWYAPTIERKACELALAFEIAAMWPRRTLLWVAMVLAYVGAVSPQGTLGNLHEDLAQLSSARAATLAAALRYPFRRSEPEARVRQRARRASHILRLES